MRRIHLGSTRELDVAYFGRDDTRLENANFCIQWEYMLSVICIATVEYIERYQRSGLRLFERESLWPLLESLANTKDAGEDQHP